MEVMARIHLGAIHHILEVNDNHQGDEELITTYTLESLESAESAVIPTGTGSDYNGKWTEFSGAWGRTIGGMLGRAAPAVPIFVMIFHL